MNSKRIKWHQHFGVYGICYNKKTEKLLVIEKVLGPYQGRYDLPGGSLNGRESLMEALSREFKEEVGKEIKVVNNLGVFDFLVETCHKDTTHTHHIAAFYTGELVESADSCFKISDKLINENGYEFNDSTGAVWVHLNRLHENNSSPLVMKAVEWIQLSSLSNEIVKYDKWKILHG